MLADQNDHTRNSFRTSKRTCPYCRSTEIYGRRPRWVAQIDNMELASRGSAVLSELLVSQTLVILAEEIRNLTPSARGEPLGEVRRRAPQENAGQFHCGRGSASKVIGWVDGVFLGVLVGKGIANAAIAPANAPKMANSTLWVVYENAIPAMLTVRGESTAKTSFVAKSDRSKLGITIPAMNKVNTTS